ncbi:hypothetical protein GCM10010921_20580 [Microbacterium album]|uniref:Uncharacterized protein n=2 Tax=Microbacterium album TaxID=2053191 RepID=A0A917IG02_9MICO|nr:hypothetical protein GCM10010921_20580 [Microbacterium album]
MLAADIEQQLKSMDAAARAQFVLDLVDVVYNYVTSDAVGEEQVSSTESDGLAKVRDAAREHAASAQPSD